MLTDMAEALSARGLSVEVITSRQRYDDPYANLPFREVINGVSVTRIATTRFGRSSLVLRAVDYLTFYLSATLVLLRMSRRGDVVVCKTDPPMLSVVVGPFARLRGAKVANWLQDLFPEAAERNMSDRSRQRTRPLFKLLRSLRNRSLRRASFNVVIGDLMRDMLVEQNVDPQRIRLIPNWADGALMKARPFAESTLRRELVPKASFVVGYSGNLGRVHDVETMLAAIRTVEREFQDVSISWLIIGGGAGYEKLRQDVEREGLTSVVFAPYQPRSALPDSLAAADVHIASLRPEFEGLIVPSKFSGIAAAGRPTIFIGDHNGEIARWITRYDCGVVVSPGDAGALTCAILALVDNPARLHQLGANARRAFDAHFALPAAVGAFEAALARIEPRS